MRPRRRRYSSRCEGYLLLPVAMVIAVLAAVAFLMSRESTVDMRTAGNAADADAARYVAEAGLRHALWKADTDACSGYGLPATAFGGHSYQAVFTPDSGSPVSVTVTGTLASGAARQLKREGLRINQTPSVLRLQPDAGSATDTRLYEWKPNWNYGEYSNLPVEGWTTSRSHSLIQFDLSEIPGGAQVIRAVLELYQNSTSSNGGLVSVHRVIRSWVEGDGTGSSGIGATWNEAEPGIPWTTPGGDFDALEYAVTQIPVGVRGPFQWDITDLVGAWHSGFFPNHGLLLKPGTDSTGLYFTSSDDPAIPEHPVLTVTYACACGVVCGTPPPVCDADFSPNASVAEFSTAGQTYRYNRGITHFPQGQSINATPAPPGGGWITVGNSGRLVLLDLDGNLLDDGFDTGLDSLQGVAFIPAGAKAGHLAIVKENTLYFADPTVTPASASYTTHVLPFVSAAGGVTYIDGGTYGGHLAVADTTSGVVHIFDQSLNLVTTLNTAATLDAPEGIAHLRNTDKFLLVDKNLNRAFVIHADLTVSQNYDLVPYGWGEPSAVALNPSSCDHLVADHANDRYKALNAVSGPLDIRVAASSDDAEELMTTNDVDLTSTDLQLVEDLSVAQTVGLRFDNVVVPKGATITSAWIQFQTAATNTGPMNLTLRGEAADDAAAFAAVAANVSSRAPTAASTAWSPGNWQTVGEAGPAQQTPDIAALIQEIVDRPGWAPGNALVVLVSGSGTRTAASFDGDPAGAPLLHIDF